MKFYKNFLVYWCLIYLLIAFVGRFTSTNKEYFPFFRWSLYSKTPNRLSQVFILVEKMGDSVLSQPTDVRDLFAFHHINSIDVNLTVQTFRKEVENLSDPLEHPIFKILPDNSTFKLYETVADLSITDYKSTKTTQQILTVQNNEVYFE